MLAVLDQRRYLERTHFQADDIAHGDQHRRDLLGLEPGTDGGELLHEVKTRCQQCVSAFNLDTMKLVQGLFAHHADTDLNPGAAVAMYRVAPGIALGAQCIVLVKWVVRCVRQLEYTAHGTPSHDLDNLIRRQVLKLFSIPLIVIRHDRHVRAQALPGHAQGANVQELDVVHGQLNQERDHEISGLAQFPAFGGQQPLGLCLRTTDPVVAVPNTNRGVGHGLGVHAQGRGHFHSVVAACRGTDSPLTFPAVRLCFLNSGVVVKIQGLFFAGAEPGFCLGPDHVVRGSNATLEPGYVLWLIVPVGQQQEHTVMHTHLGVHREVSAL